MYWIDDSRCAGCATCMNACPANAIYIIDNKAHIDEHRCTGCGICAKACPHQAILEREVVRVEEVKQRQDVRSPDRIHITPKNHRPFLNLIDALLKDVLPRTPQVPGTGPKWYGCPRWRGGYRKRCGRKK